MPMSLSATAPDWGVGHYERTAVQLMPAAEVIVEQAAPSTGMRVVDLGCGTGNAALLAAARGAHVTGIDPAPRLLEVARGSAVARGLDISFAQGHAAAIPLPDASADLLLSVFGVIFAADAVAAAAEMARVTTAKGQIVLSAWIPEGAIFEMNRAAREAVGAATAAPPGPQPFPWHDRDALTDLLGPHGFTVAVQHRQIAFSGASPKAYLDAGEDSHPLSIAGRAVLEPLGQLEELRDRLLTILEAANEDPRGFRVTSGYVVATATRIQPPV